MAGTWGKWHGSWERPGASAAPPTPELESDHEDEEDEGDPAEWAKWLAERDFTLIRDRDVPEDRRGKPALALDIDDRPAVIAFTSLKLANEFAGQYPELFDDPNDIQGFVVEGCDLVKNNPDFAGILIDSGSDDERYLSPELLARIRQEMGRRL